jgi:hypothetical protein
MLYTKLVVKSMVLALVFLACQLTTIASGKTKSTPQESKYIACKKDSCSFVVQSTSIDELKLDYSIHSSLFHKMSLTDEQILLLIKKGSYKPQNSDAKFIACSEKDGFTVWSTYDDVLIYFFKQHAQFVHNKELKDEDVKKLITSIQK